MKRCFECRAGDNVVDYDTNYQRVTVIIEGERPRTGILCGEHIAMLRDDGAQIRFK